MTREKPMAALGEAPPATRLPIIAGLAAPAYKIEVECTAALAD